MRCVFVGNIEEDNGYITEVLQEKGYDLIEAGEFDRVEKTINSVIAVSYTHLRAHETS